MDALDSIDELAQDWVRHLRATNRSARTIDIYRSATESLAENLREEGPHCRRPRSGAESWSCTSLTL
jgi:hypothetical protein